MSNELMIFENKEFGQVRTLMINREPYFVGKDVADILGYQNGSRDINRHVDNEDKTDVVIHDGSQNRNMVAINESGLYSLILSSKLPSSKKFKRWVTKEVLPSIRQTGAYISDNTDLELLKRKAVEAKLRNAKSRQASLLLKIADKIEIPEYKQVLYSHATEVVAGQRLLPLPAVDKPTYSAREIGTILGISANKVGRLANLNGLKTPEHGKLFYDKSPHSNKEVETWRYYDNVIPVLKELAEGAGVLA